MPREIQQQVCAKGKSSLQTDAINFILDRHFIETCDWQGQKQTYSATENNKGVPERAFHFHQGAAHCRRIGNAPVRRHRMPGTFWETACAVRRESRVALLIQYRLRQDRSRRISCIEKQDVMMLRHRDPLSLGGWTAACRTAASGLRRIMWLHRPNERAHKVSVH